MTITSRETKKENPKANAPAPTDMAAWDMALSILTGLRQARSKAEAEYTSAVTATKGNPFGTGVAPAAHLVEALSEALRGLEPDLRQIARLNARMMPEDPTMS